jgi:hypothetical protein
MVLLSWNVNGRYAGAVARSRSSSHNIAYSRSGPHISSDGWSPPQNAGRSGCPKIRHRLFAPSCTQRTPAGFPSGMPGMGLVIDGAVQQAPQLSRQFMAECGVKDARTRVYSCRTPVLLDRCYPTTYISDS